MLFSSRYCYLVCLLSLVALEASAKTFVYCSEGSPSTFNPQLASDGTTFNASSRTIYNRLVGFKRGTTELIPSLASSWSYDSKTMTWRFELRKGVHWHSNKHFRPTRPFNADDVLFSFNRMRLKGHPYHKVSGGSYQYFEAMAMSSIIKDIVRVNDYRVDFVLAKNFTTFLANLAMDFASILSKEYGDKMLAANTPEVIDQQPIGTGAFVLQRYVKDSQIRYKSFAKHFAGRSPLDKLIFSITVDKSVRMQKLRTGECHLISYPAVQDLAMIRKGPKMRLAEMEGLNVSYLALNTKKKPFDNVLVRKAIHHALNRQYYIDAIYRNTAVVAKNPIPPTMWGYNDKVVDYDYNPSLAKKLLAKAGHGQGFSTELWTLPIQRPYMPDGKKLGVLMQADLAKIGIKVKLVTYDWPTYLSKAKNGEHQMLQIGWSGDNGDPDNFLQVLLSCPAVKAGANYARWCNKQFDELTTDAATATDIATRTALYRQAQVLFKQHVPWITIAHAKIFRGLRSGVQNFKIDPLGGDRFDGVDLR